MNAAREFEAPIAKLIWVTSLLKSQVFIGISAISYYAHIA